MRHFKSSHGDTFHSLGASGIFTILWLLNIELNSHGRLQDDIKSAVDQIWRQFQRFLSIFPISEQTIDQNFGILDEKNFV